MSETTQAPAAHFLCEFGAPGTRRSQDTLALIFSHWTCTQMWVITSVPIHKFVRCTQLAPNLKEKRELEKNE